ncbi:hypothetical protein RN001_016236 [Aquatica leii]|uniref:Neuronal PAS domain-containing protein 4 n=1 Tax=Aquatica leii TaxID=1421715 RepID=A0AAN7NXB6_9COLE|nr:hypothetical protein RN001_016236 [Aquatica leii]
MFTRFDANKSTKGASKLRRDLINAEIANLRELLPLPPSTRQRLSQLQLMALVCVYVRKSNYFQQAFKCHDAGLHQAPTPNIGFSKALSGFLMMMTQNGKLLYISDNAAEYLGHSMEDLLIHGDSVYDIIDKQDHQAIQCELGRPINSSGNGNSCDEIRVFLCRMNVSRNARRQMRFGDQKVVLVQGRYLSFLPLCSRNEPVFLATCTPVAMPETRECVVQGATNVFTSIHSMDMRFIHIDNNGEFYLGFPLSDLQGVSWYRLLHWDCTREAQTKHRLITQSEQERSCILLAQFQRRSGEWLWMHCVLQVKESSESNQQPVIVCTNQVLSDSEASVMRNNSWLYHYYSVQNKLQYGLAYDVAPTTRLLYYPEHHQPEFTSSHETTGYAHLSAMPGTLQPHITHHSASSHPHHNQHHHHHRRADPEPVDYSYSKRKPKDLQNLELDVANINTTEIDSGSGSLLVITHSAERPRTLLKIDPSELIEQWNPSPPWSDTLQKVPDLCHQELSPYIGSAPPTPTTTPSTHSGNAFSFDWMPEQSVPSMTIVATSLEDAEGQNYWPSEHRLFPLQPPPKRNPPPGRSETADRDTP